MYVCMYSVAFDGVFYTQNIFICARVCMSVQLSCMYIYYI